jgi:hypothetical protein
MEYIMGQRNVIFNNLDNDIYISPSYEEDSFTNERHENLSCPSSPRKKIIENDNDIIDEQ